VKQRLDKDAFDVVAHIESDDPGSKVRGGDLGWFQRHTKNLPEQALAAAFALPAGAVSEPIRGADGGYLVKVLEIEPDLGDQQLLDRLGSGYAAELPAQVLEQADLRRPDGTPFEGGEPAATVVAPAAREPGRER
jgi:parvulin-like peptidyl-prolyl isomerase